MTGVLAKLAALAAEWGEGEVPQESGGHGCTYEWLLATYVVASQWILN